MRSPSGCLSRRPIGRFSNGDTQQSGDHRPGSIPGVMNHCDRGELPPYAALAA